MNGWVDGHRDKIGRVGGWTDEEETDRVVAEWKRGWGGGKMMAPTHPKAEGDDFILLEARGPIGKDAGDKEL